MPDGGVPSEILAHYEEYEESTRLSSGTGLLEKERTRRILTRYLPSPPATVLDVGGGTGVHALWLAGLGHRVHLIDPVPRHVEGAAAAAAAQRVTPLASTRVGEAQHLEQEDESMDAVLLLGPLYHLTERADRLAALTEAGRVLKPGGVVVAAAISRFASLLDGLWRNLVHDPAFRAILDRDLVDGQHRNTVDNLTYFTTAFLHHPEELRAELVESGLADVEVLAVEGVAGAIPDFDERWANPSDRELLLDLVERTETEPSLLGASQHLLGVGRKGG